MTHCEWRGRTFRFLPPWKVFVDTLRSINVHPETHLPPFLSLFFFPHKICWKKKIQIKVVSSCVQNNTRIKYVFFFLSIYFSQINFTYIYRSLLWLLMQGLWIDSCTMKCFACERDTFEWRKWNSLAWTQNVDDKTILPSLLHTHKHMNLHHLLPAACHISLCIGCREILETPSSRHKLSSFIFLVNGKCLYTPSSTRLMQICVHFLSSSLSFPSFSLRISISRFAGTTNVNVTGIANTKIQRIIESFDESRYHTTAIRVPLFIFLLHLATHKLSDRVYNHSIRCNSCYDTLFIHNHLGVLILVGCTWASIRCYEGE